MEEHKEYQIECQKCDGNGGWGRLYGGPGQQPSESCSACAGQGFNYNLSHDEIKAMATAINENWDQLKRAKNSCSCHPHYEYRCIFCDRDSLGGHEDNCITRIAMQL